MDVQPTRLALAGEDRLLIEWSDGQKREYTFRQLRDNCPCATCREKRSQPTEAAPAKSAGGFIGLPVLSTAEAKPLKVHGMKPVGNYAYAIEFSDGHNTGIYTLEFLRELGKEVE
jgi:DUF971 family protein